MPKETEAQHWIKEYQDELAHEGDMRAQIYTLNVQVEDLKLQRFRIILVASVVTALAIGAALLAWL